jgi:hypothetical protein
MLKLGMDPEASTFRPHMSLVYDVIPFEERRRLASEGSAVTALPPLFPTPASTIPSLQCACVVFRSRRRSGSEIPVCVKFHTRVCM